MNRSRAYELRVTRTGAVAGPTPAYADYSRDHEIVAAFSSPHMLSYLTLCARELHHRAHLECFIVRSVHFPVECEASVTCARASSVP